MDFPSSCFEICNKGKLSLQNKAVYAGAYYNGNMCGVCLSDAGLYDTQMGNGIDSRSDCSQTFDKGKNYCYLYYGNCKTFANHQIESIWTKEKLKSIEYNVGGLAYK